MDCLLTDKAVQVLRDAKLSGYELRPVSVRFSGTSDRDFDNWRLWELVVTGWGGTAPASSGIRMVEQCAACKHVVYSCFTQPNRLVDANAWDGNDLFMVWPLSRFIFLSPKGGTILRKANLRGAEVTALNTLECTTRCLTPGLLSYWMPEERVNFLAQHKIPLDQHFIV